MINELYKVVEPNRKTFCKIEFKGGKLSIAGVQNPYKNGDCGGSYGQIVDELTVNDLMQGWTPKRLRKFQAIWRKWHLNDMRMGCEHQREAWDPEKTLIVEKIVISTKFLDYKVANRIGKLTEAEETKLAKADKLYSDYLWGRGDNRTDIIAAVRDGWLEVSGTKESLSGCTYPIQHRDGILGKTCPVCGYKYGSLWLTEKVPANVIKWLAALPETENMYAWV